MKNQKIIDWLDALAAKTPTPGGGAVAGLNGAIAAAQLNMIERYSDKKKLKTTVDLGEKIDLFLQLCENDEQAFLALRRAYKSKNQAAVQEALVKACEPGINIYINCRQILDYFKDNAANFNKNFLADLIVVTANLSAAVESARAMIKVNSASIDDPDLKPQLQDIMNGCDQLLLEIENLKKTAWQDSKTT